jgi:hypothetical protein
MKKLLLIGIFCLPLTASAQVPAFPMSFWGNVTINGSAVPVGTIVRVYYGNELAGSVTAQEAGVYGYTEPTKQKLVVGQGEGVLTFKVQSPSHNSGQETAGSSAVTYSSFTSGLTTNLNLAFTIPAPVLSPSGGGRSGGGGVSGGGSTAIAAPVIPGDAMAAPLDSTKVVQIELIKKQLVLLLTQLILMLQEEIVRIQIQQSS